jgi:hypothetical protein
VSRSSPPRRILWRQPHKYLYRATFTVQQLRWHAYFPSEALDGRLGYLALVPRSSAITVGFRKGSLSRLKRCGVRPPQAPHVPRPGRRASPPLQDAGRYRRLVDDWSRSSCARTRHSLSAKSHGWGTHARNTHPRILPDVPLQRRCRHVGEDRKARSGPPRSTVRIDPTPDAGPVQGPYLEDRPFSCGVGRPKTMLQEHRACAPIWILTYYA